MDDVARRQATAGREHALSRLHGALRHRLAFDRRAAARFQCARDAGAHPEMIVRGVHDGVGGLGGDVAVGDLEPERRDGERDHESGVMADG